MTFDMKKMKGGIIAVLKLNHSVSMIGHKMSIFCDIPDSIKT